MTHTEGLVFVWFQKGGAFLRYEARDLANGRYELRIIDADGAERAETFNDSSSLNKRQIDLERELAEAGWTGPHGWNL